MDYQFQPGRPLVICGSQGSGKSRLAREIAGKIGAFVEVDFLAISTPEQLQNVLWSEPATVIVDGLPVGEKISAILNDLFENDSVVIGIRRGAVKRVKSPSFIFCTGTLPALPGDGALRRFSVISLDDAAPPHQVTYDRGGQRNENNEGDLVCN